MLTMACKSIGFSLAKAMSSTQVVAQQQMDPIVPPRLEYTSTLYIQKLINITLYRPVLTVPQLFYLCCMPIWGVVVVTGIVLPFIHHSSLSNDILLWVLTGRITLF